MHIGLLTVALFIGHAQSLKDKRQVLRSIKDRVRGTFNVTLCEFDGQDKWQIASLAFAVLGTDNRIVDATLHEIVSTIESESAAQITEYRIEFL